MEILEGDYLKNKSMSSSINNIYQTEPKTLFLDELHPKKLIEFRSKQYSIIPLIDKARRLVDVLNFNQYKSYLPLDVVVMAGGKGSDWLPLQKIYQNLYCQLEISPLWSIISID